MADIFVRLSVFKGSGCHLGRHGGCLIYLLTRLQSNWSEWIHWPPPPKKKKKKKKTWCSHQPDNSTMKMTDLQYFQSTGGILDAIFRIKHFRKYNLFNYLFMWFFVILPRRCKIVCFYFRGRKHFAASLPIWRPFWTPWWILDYLITRWQSNWSQWISWPPKPWCRHQNYNATTKNVWCIAILM